MSSCICVAAALPMRTGFAPSYPASHGNLPFIEAPFTQQTVHGLNLRWVARHSASQPLTPVVGLLQETRVHECEQCEGGVAQPTVPVIPIARCAGCLRQGRCRGGNNATGRSIGQRLECHEKFPTPRVSP